MVRYVRRSRATVLCARPSPLWKIPAAEHQILHQQSEGQRDEGDVEIAEPDGQRPMMSPWAARPPTGGDGGQYGPAVGGGQLAAVSCADPGEGDLAEPDHAPFAGHQRPRQEDDRVGEGLGHEADPEALHKDGERGRGHDENDGPANLRPTQRATWSRAADVEPAMLVPPGG